MDFDALSTPRRRVNPFHAAVWGLMAIRLLIGGAYALWTPPFANPDELSHYDVARFIAREGRQPTLADAPVSSDYHIFVQYTQPPLYYWMTAPLVRLLGGIDTAYPISNPDPMGTQTDRSYFIRPLPMNTRPLWALRAVSVVIGAVTVGVMFAATRVWFPDEPLFALFVALLAALYPPLLMYTAAWFSNDTPLLLYGAVALWLTGRLHTRPHLPTVAALVMVGVLAALTKLNGVALLPLVGVMALLTLKRTHPRWLWGGVMALAALVALWMAANVWQCGRVVCRIHRTPEHLDTWPEFVSLFRAEPFADGLRHMADTLALQLIHPHVMPPRYATYAAWMVLAVAVIGWARMPRSTWRTLWPPVLLIASALGLALFRVWYLAVGYMPLRYILVATPALLMLLARGFVQWRAFGVMLVTTVWTSFALLAPLWVIAPLHERPLISPTLPPSVIPLAAPCVYEGGVRWLAYEPIDSGVRLYFDTRQPLDTLLFARLTHENDNALPEQSGGTLGTFAYPTTRWQVGEIVAFDLMLTRPIADGALSVELLPVQPVHYLESNVIQSPLTMACE